MANRRVSMCPAPRIPGTRAPPNNHGMPRSLPRDAGRPGREPLDVRQRAASGRGVGPDARPQMLERPLQLVAPRLAVALPGHGDAELEMGLASPGGMGQPLARAGHRQGPLGRRTRRPEVPVFVLRLRQEEYELQRPPLVLAQVLLATGRPRRHLHRRAVIAAEERELRETPDPLTIVVSAITQDEAVPDEGSGATCPDAAGVGTSTPWVRAERSGTDEDGRVYHIAFTSRDPAGAACSGVVTVCVPHDQKGGPVCVDQGALHDSTQCP